MDVRSKQQWAIEETSCLVALSSSIDIQNKPEGASKTKHVFEQIQHEMAAEGYDTNIKQINNKQKKLKKGVQGPKAETPGEAAMVDSLASR